LSIIFVVSQLPPELVATETTMKAPMGSNPTSWALSGAGAPDSSTKDSVEEELCRTGGGGGPTMYISKGIAVWFQGLETVTEP
jgi:hypothetical protein